MSPRLCRCHGAVMLKDRREWRCAVKVRATWRRAAAKYRRSAKGNARQVTNNARRVYVGRRCLGRVDTPQLARTVNVQLQHQLAAFLEGYVAR